MRSMGWIASEGQSQGTTSVVPKGAPINVGFSPCAESSAPLQKLRACSPATDTSSWQAKHPLSVVGGSLANAAGYIRADLFVGCYRSRNVKGDTEIMGHEPVL